MRELLNTITPEFVPSRCANACGAAAILTASTSGGTKAGSRALEAGIAAV
jgi:hypothetical protein|tara:strand:+ start:1189 stop:1338 length:150 start_codon:yes stop_codon:yes gene_type:complete